MKTIAVLFGGESVEHDVSILTALQFMDAMDPDKYEALPVYADRKGRWWTGMDLRKKEFYPLSEGKSGTLARVALPFTPMRGDRPYLMEKTKGVFAKSRTIPFDVIVPAIHGTNGEDGTLQGMLDFLGVPYAGCGTLASAATMDKDFTKRMLKGNGIPVLDHITVTRNVGGGHIDAKAIKADITRTFGKSPYPVIVKPCHLGSSIGVTPANNFDDVMAGLILCFRMDDTALIEPFVDNLVEYNIAASRAFDGSPTTSVIERPLKASEFLDFKDKYLSGDDNGAKLKTSTSSEGMASLNRVINPDELTEKQAASIHSWAKTAFSALSLAGSVRIDFLGNEKTGELWLNEINTVPGSFAFYLWQESEPAVGFTALTTALIEEGLARTATGARGTDPALGGAVIFKDQ